MTLLFDIIDLADILYLEQLVHHRRHILLPKEDIVHNLADQEAQNGYSADEA